MPKGKKIKTNKQTKTSLVTKKKTLSEQELISLLDPKRETDLKIHRVLSELPEKYCIIILETTNQNNVLNTRIIKYFTDQKIPGIYITINKGALDLIENINNQNIPTKNIIFIDAITLHSNGQKSKTGNIKYLESPKDLVELSLALKKSIETINGKKFVILDSLSTMLVYNNPKAVEKFVHSLSGKIRAWNAQGILLLLDSEKNEIKNTIAQFCDKTSLI